MNRIPSGRRPRRAPGILLPVLSLCLLLPAVALALTPFPVASLGDIWFQVDQTAFRDDDGGVVREFTLRITNNQLEFQGDEEEGEQLGRVSVKLTFQDEDEDEIGEASREFEFVVPDPGTARSADYAELLVMREEVDPRARFVKVEVSDLNARKRGLLYMVTGKRRNGEATGALEPAPFLGREFAVSDLQFAWSAERAAAEDSPWMKNGYNVVPNPSRAFGLLQPVVSAYFEVYDQRPFPGPRAYVIDHEVVDAAGTTVLSKADTVQSRQGFWVRTVSFNGSRLPTGRFLLRTTVRDLIGEGRAVSERDFNLVWGTEAWVRTEEDVLDEARVLFTEDEYDRFREMSIADRELYLAEFWRAHDPTPATPVNELREEFLRRVDYANRHFTAFGRKGMITDRGRIYIRFGEPDEIEAELVPTRDNQLDRLVDDFAEENVTGGNLGSADEFDTRPYVIWTYTVQGAPLFPEREFATSVTGLRFVFVDESGTGHFVLRYASDFINY